jgi:hypothetical protein
MKTLALLALLSFPLASHAAGTSLSVDLDRDGKPDSVNLLTSGENSVTLEVVLSSTGAKLSFPNMGARFGTACSDKDSISITAAGPNAFRINNADESSECSADLAHAVVGMSEGALNVSELGFNYLHGHANGYDVDLRTRISANFAAGTLTVKEVLDNHRSKTEKLAPGCKLSLASLDQNGNPDCAALQAQFIDKELSDPEAKPFCPSFEGAYVCDFGGYTKVLTVIHRDVSGRVYDINELDATITADGKSHEGNKSSMGSIFLRATCNRAEMKIEKADHLILSKGDVRKKWYDLRPWFRSTITFTQKDLNGDSFERHEITSVLDDDKNNGSYRQTSNTTIGCKRVSEK